MGLASRERRGSLVNAAYPFRLGTTSYILPDDLLPNVAYLAGKVRDVELVLFDLDGGPSNLPTPAQVAGLRRLADKNDLTYTVHLPLDLRLAPDGSPRHASLDKARRVIDCTRELSPWAYVAHLDGRDILPPGVGAQAFERWQDQAVQALELVAGWLDDPRHLALENLEGYPLDLNPPLLARAPVSRTVDIGHLWLDGHDPIAYLREALPRTRVIHIHGLNGRDHSSLAHVPAQELARVFKEIIATNFTGILTIEIFNQDDFLTSMQALENLGF